MRRKHFEDFSDLVKNSLHQENCNTNHSIELKELADRSWTSAKHDDAQSVTEDDWYPPIVTSNCEENSSEEIDADNQKWRSKFNFSRSQSMGGLQKDSGSHKLITLTDMDNVNNKPDLLADKPHMAKWIVSGIA